MAKLKYLILFLFISSFSFSENKIAFLENKGQWEKQIQYKACVSDASIFLEKDKLTFVYFSAEDIANLHHNGLENEHFSCGHTHIDNKNTDIHFFAYNVQFINCNKDALLKGKEKRIDYYNFFIGNNKEKWAGGVKSFNKIEYSEIYNNIDLITYSSKEKFKYDFIIKSNGNVNSIKLNYNGVESINITENNVVIKTSIKDIVELAPYAYQIINGQKVEVECNYKLDGTILSFALPNGYDKTKTLIIDPTIEGCTFAGTGGGSNTDTWGSTATFDATGNIYIGARAFSATYPVTTGAFQSSSMGASMGGTTTIGIGKYSPDATTLIYSTYLGGYGTDTPHSLFVDNNDELYVYGSSNSTNFPCSSGAYDNTHNGQEDIIVTHFNNNGTGIIGSTYIGGSGNDGVGDPYYGGSAINYGDDFRGEIIVDANGNCFVTSVSMSTNFPVSAGAYQTTHGGNRDGVIFSLNSDLSTLRFATYFGGSAYDAAYGIRLDASNNIFVSGSCGNGFFTATGYLTSYQGGSKDGYIVKFSPNCSALLGSSYYGTSGIDQAFFVDLNQNGDIYIYGQNGASITPTAGMYANPNSRQFIAEFTQDLNTLIYQTVIGSGSSQSDFAPSAFMVDICDRVYIAGHSNVSGYKSGSPTTITSGGFSSSGGVYLAALDPSGTGLMFGSYIQGADHVDGGTSRFDPNGMVYHSVCSCPYYSPDLPTTPGAYDNTNSTDNCDLGVFKIDFDVSIVHAGFQTDTIDSLCAPAIIDFNNHSQNATSYLWDFGNGVTSTLTNPTYTYTTAGTYTVSLIAYNSTSCNFSDTTEYTVYINNCGITSNDTTICYGDTATLYVDAFNPQTYNWSHGLPATLGPHQVSPLTTTDYYITVTDSIGNVFVDTSTVTIIPLPVVDLGNDTMLCPSSPSLVLDAGNTGSTYLWSDNSTNQTLTITTTGTYTVSVTNASGCLNIDSIYVYFNSMSTSVNITNASCYGYSDGAIDYTITSGLSPFTFSWSNFAHTEDINSLLAGSYTVSVTDSLGCVSTETFVVSEPNVINIASNVSNLRCYHDNSGEIDITVNGGNGGFTYNWSNSQTSEDISNLIPNSYSVTVTDANNCTATDNYTITEPALLTSSITPRHLLCFNDTDGEADLTVAGGTPSYHYNWTNGQNTQDANNLTSGTYLVTITDANNCIIIDSVTIVGVGTPLVASTNNSMLLCYGDNDANAQVSASGATPPYTYNWSIGGTSTNVTGLSAGNYYVTVTDANNCQIIKPIHIVQPAEIHISLPSDFHMCKNPDETITASTTGGTAPYSYSWNNGGNSSSITVSPTVETTYIVTVTDANNCTMGNSIIVKIYPPLQIQALANKDTVCPGDGVLLTADYSGGTGNPYQFYIDGQLTTIPKTVYPTQVQTFTIIIKDKCDKTAEDTYTLYNYPMPEVSFNSDIVDGCQPLTVHFNNYVNYANCSYIWDFDENDGISISHNKSPVHTFYNDGIFDITCVATNEFNCKNSQTLPNMIMVYPKPIAQFIANPEIASIIKPIINFTNYSKKAYYYYWFFGDGDTSNIENPHHRYNSIGNYNVELIATSIHQCKDTSRYTIIINDEFTLYVPTAFTPDGDGINDGFRAFGNGIDEKNYLLIVYDRWGEPIWQSTDLHKVWNGIAKNGNQYVQSGTYIWKVVCKDFNGERHSLTGKVNILR